MLKLFLSLRYLRKKKIVSLSVTAVAVSAALLIVVSNLFHGFINAFEKSAVDIMGDVVLDPPVKFAHYQSFISQLQQIAAVKTATATLSGQGLLHLGQGNVRAVRILGIMPAQRAAVTGFKHTLLKQRNSTTPPSFELADSQKYTTGFVGIAVVAEPNERTDQYDFHAVENTIGKNVLLTTGTVTERTNTTSGKPAKQFKRKPLRFTIADIVFTGIYEIDKTFIYLPIDQLQKELYPDAKAPLADQVQIKLADNTQTDATLAQIRGIWAHFAAEKLGWDPYLINETSILTAQQAQSRYIAEIRKQMSILLLIFGIVSFSVVLLVFCILYMIAITHQKDIAIIKSCGASNTSVALVFVTFGACVGIFGSVTGAILGSIITKNINTIENWISIIFGLKLWKSSVYLFSKIPSEIDWHSALRIAAFAVLATTLGALIPALVAAATRPVNILKYE